MTTPQPTKPLHDLESDETIKATIKAMADARRRFVLLVWDADAATPQAAIMANTYPADILHMMAQAAGVLAKGALSTVKEGALH